MEPWTCMWTRWRARDSLSLTPPVCHKRHAESVLGRTDSTYQVSITRARGEPTAGEKRSESGTIFAQAPASCSVARAPLDGPRATRSAFHLRLEEASDTPAEPSSGDTFPTAANGTRNGSLAKEQGQCCSETFPGCASPSAVHSRYRKLLAPRWV